MPLSVIYRARAEELSELGHEMDDPVLRASLRAAAEAWRCLAERLDGVGPVVPAPARAAPLRKAA